MKAKRIPWIINKWFMWQHCEMTEGIESIEGQYKMIRPSQNKKIAVSAYSPFDYFNEPHPHAEDIFELTYENNVNLYISSKYIHTLFSSLQNESEAYRWVQYFGPPILSGSILSEKSRIVDDIMNFVVNVNAGRPGETAIACRAELYVDDVLREAFLMRWTIELHQALLEHYSNHHQKSVTIPIVDERTYEALMLYVDRHGLLLSDIIGYRTDADRLNEGLAIKAGNQGVDTLLQSLIKRIFGLMLKNCSISPSYQIVDNGAEPIWEWNCDTLLSMMYLMVFIDIQGGTFRRCARNNCKIYFATPKATQKYCSLYCQEWAKKNRFDEKSDAKDRKSIYNKKYYRKLKRKPKV